jgi:pyochelin synthetase
MPTRDIAPRSTEELLEDLAHQTRQPAAQVRRLFAVFKANTLAAGRYLPRGYGGPIALAVPPEAAETARVWADPANGQITTVQVPGDHFSMLRPPHSEVLAEHVSRLLAGVELRPVREEKR